MMHRWAHDLILVATFLFWPVDAEQSGSWGPKVIAHHVMHSGLAGQDPGNITPAQRSLEDEQETMDCDGAFLGCMGNSKCANCFSDLNKYDIDWATVARDTPCDEVVSFLRDEKLCTDLKGDATATTAFCLTFHSCAFWTHDDDNGADENGDANDEEDTVDCDNLTECKWEGMHESFIGDGICQDNIRNGCYNTAICNWDGGDCCDDTCEVDEDSYVKCGHDGYWCRDPDSANCDKRLQLNCKNNKKPDTPEPSCGVGQTLYRLVMYDSFGDGWDDTTITVSPSDKPGTKVFEGGLKDGKQGTEFICLSSEPSCYHVDSTGGTWGLEVSWDIRSYSEGSSALASGGSPMSCDFPVSGGKCENTCYGKNTIDPTKDEGYKDFKEMYKCIDKKCVIQVGACEKDPQCVDCLKEEVADKCHSEEAFNAVIDCTMCQCTDRKGSEFCVDKANPGIVIPGDNSYKKPLGCTPGEVLKGGAAVMEFGKCTDFDSVAMVVTDFDQNNFGYIDDFEACAHAFKGKKDKGGKTALECLQILVDAKDGKGDGESEKADLESIKALANLVYTDSENFCDCAKKASEECPLCPSFMNFKTLLYESLDACMALDEIDCAAWEEYYQPCEKNLERTFGGVDFSESKSQCSYIQGGCGGVGPFPAFRHLDCYDEVTPVAWDFLQVYKKACAADSPNPAPSPPRPTPPAPTKKPYTPSDSTPSGGGKPYVPPDAPSPSGKKDYVPPEERGKDKKKKEYKSEDDEKKSHWFRNFVLLSLGGYGALLVYKRYSEGFSFQSYRRMQRNFGEEDMYNSIAMESSTSFEPPSLPPPPSMMGGSQYSNQQGQYGQY